MAPLGEEREAFVSGAFAPDESVFDRFGAELASERFRNPDRESESSRVEVDRYWRRTAARRAATEARRADGLARADRAVRRAREAERGEQAERERSRSRSRGRSGAGVNTAGSSSSAEPSDPYRELLHAWARETAQQPPVESGRRTVSIKGHGAEGYTARNGTRASAAERHLHLSRYERRGFQPDRVAMWAVLLGMVMVLAAAASAHATVLAHHVH
jgi:hypothetical protein